MKIDASISYPRSGNTWLVNSLKDYLGAQRTEIGDSGYAGGSVVVNEIMLLSVAREVDYTMPLGVKTHKYPHELLQQHFLDSKMLYVLRDPRDVIISYYFYNIGFIDRNTDKATNFDEEDFLTFLIENIAGLESHISAWKNYAGDIKIVRYEDLKYQYIETLELIQKFLGYEVVVPVNEVKNRYVDNFNKVDRFANVLKGNNMDFYRKGIVGDWENYYTEKHRKIVNRCFGDALMELGYVESKLWWRDVEHG